MSLTNSPCIFFFCNESFKIEQNPPQVLPEMTDWACHFLFFFEIDLSATHLDSRKSFKQTGRSEVGGGGGGVLCIYVWIEVEPAMMREKDIILSILSSTKYRGDISPLRKVSYQKANCEPWPIFPKPCDQ